MLPARFVRVAGICFLGEAKVIRRIWVSTEDVAGGAATSGMASERTVLIPSWAAVIASAVAATGSARATIAAAAASVVANALHEEQAQVDHDPFSQRDGWRAYGVTTRTFGFNFHGASYTALLSYLHDGGLQLSVGEGDDAVSAPLLWRAEGDALQVSFAGQTARVQVFVEAQAHEDVAHVFAPQGATRITVVDALAHAGDTQEAGGRLTAPMPGKVVSFAVKAGDKVKFTAIQSAGGAYTVTSIEPATMQLEPSMRLRIHSPPKARPRMNEDSMSSKEWVEAPSTSDTTAAPAR